MTDDGFDAAVVGEGRDPAARLVAIEGARNLRDIGGYPTADGRSVRWRKVFRGGHPAAIRPDQHQQFRQLGLATILDLRTNDERARQPYPPALLDGVDYRWRDYRHSDSDLLARLRTATVSADEVREGILKSYRALPYEQAEGVGMLFRLLADGATPLLVNCTAGKDRTGTAIALLLLALGVSRADVVDDYTLTERLEPPASTLRALAPDGPYAFLLDIDPEIWRPMMRADAGYLDAQLEGLERAHGSIEKYLADEHGVTEERLACLRDRLLE